MPATLATLQTRYPGAVTFRFGDGPDLCNRLLALVRSGAKRATCGRLQDFLDDPAAMPAEGRCDIATTWDGTPALVIRTRKLIRIRFCDVTWDLARQEGEDAALSGWQEGHQGFFARNGGFDPEMLLLFEIFDLVEDLAQPPGG
ncbi:MAG: ASCH domain-containing protein [Limimaricola sp.]|uniref:ASCH domain-containing protein n=1 Tax=Limimaricola sp. TaxID=2211665 RepID=UPI001E141C98|nr:ASCH domain-containing protein [Limimaricola sp.]MBI1417437.1 ASCH domain-containing protein [Limimaricola sp.]